jgi:membrane protein implicated in regulation of membrane protease activity
MRSDWGLIARGLMIASLGAGASMLYIVGLSAFYVGRYTLAIWTLAGALMTAVLFHRLLTPYLDSLDRRAYTNEPIDSAGRRRDI